MSWASYEPMPSSDGGAGQDQLKPVMQYKPENPAYIQLAKQQPKKQSQEPEQQAKPQKSKWADISEYEEIYDWVYIFIGIIVTELALLFLVRLFPEFFGKCINVWYNRFKLEAVLADVFIIALGIGISRYIYTEFIYPKHDWNALYFTGVAVFVQILHDLLFYIGVIQQVPKGHNAIIDMMKEYASNGGYYTILADSALMVSSVGLAMIFKGMEAHVTTFIGLLAVYAIPYILETRNDYSSLT